MARNLLAAVVSAAFLAAVGDAASAGVGFDLHHRSSPVVRRWAEARGHPALAAEWPPQGSPEYYSKLSRHDRALLARRRGLAAAADGLLTFADGNDTYRSSDLGFLYYAEVALGTPNTTFVVALDTGSDLLWVPCECKQCAQLSTGNGTTAAQEVQQYTPSQSSTSKAVTCNNTLCGDSSSGGEPNGCSASTNGSCPYTVSYGSANTSSSGVLVEDVLHLTGEAGAATGAAVNATVVFGCGQVQTGSFLDGAGFDGLMGLGRGKVSVPSELAAAGLVASDSFSMCFSRDGVGRINFGDAGSSGQSETPLIASPVYYNVSFTSINVESTSVAAEFAAVVDSGTSFTYLNDPEYTDLATNFNSQIREKRTNFSSGSSASPFEYCYGLSSNQTEVFLPDVSLTTSGGALFPVTWPIIVLADEINGRARPIGYCLALLKSDISTNIIGQNFMTGLKVVFNRERSVLGWQKFDCYKNTPVADSPAASPGPGPAGPDTTKLTPQQNDDGNSKPGAAPSPRSAASLDAGRALGGRLSLLLPLLAAAALV